MGPSLVDPVTITIFAGPVVLLKRSCPPNHAADIPCLLPRLLHGQGQGADTIIMHAGGCSVSRSHADVLVLERLKTR